MKKKRVVKTGVEIVNELHHQSPKCPDTRATLCHIHVVCGDCTIPTTTTMVYTYHTRINWNSRKHRRKIILVMAVLAAVYFLTRRDTLYLLRPIWDTKPKPWNTYSFWPYVPEVESNADYCRHYGWERRAAARRPRIVDATLLSTEVSLLKLRLMETRDHVDVVILVEVCCSCFFNRRRAYAAKRNRQTDPLTARRNPTFPFSTKPRFEAT